MRNVQLAALTAQLLIGSAYAAPRALTPRRAAAVPDRVAARNACDVTTYTVITPKPGMEPTPVTKQFQPVYSCIPQYVVCDSSNKDKCETMYSTTSYQWLSTAVPCYNGLCTVTKVDQPVTIAAYPTYAVATCNCANAGPCVYGDSTTNVPAPTSFAYVNPGNEYYVCPYSDYYKYYSGGLGSLEVDVYSCIDGVCRVYPLGLITKTYVSTSTYQVPYEINSYFAQPTIIVIGDLDITINISIAPTSLSTVVTGTSTVTRTVTTTETTTVSDGVTVTETTSALASATAAPAVGSTFVLGASVTIFARNKRQQAARSFVVCSNGICALQQNCTNAAIFSLDVNGRLESAGSFIYASVNDITGGNGLFKLGTGPVTTGFSFNGGILSWINAAFVDGNHEAAFCQNKDNSISVIYPDGTTPDNCTPLKLTRVDPDDDISCLGINGRPISSSSSASSGTSTGSSSSSTGSVSASSGSVTSSSGSASTTGTNSASSSSSSDTAIIDATATDSTSTVASSTVTVAATTSDASLTSSGQTSATSDSTTGPITDVATVTSGIETVTSSASSSSSTSINGGGNSNLQVCDALGTAALMALCETLNGVDPCSIEALVDLAALQACTNAGGTVPVNLAGCLSVNAASAVNCIESCSGLLDTILLVDTCSAAGGSPVAADCDQFEITVAGVQTDTLADLCASLAGSNPCTGTALSSVAATDLATYITDCTLGGFLDTALSTCLLTAITPAAQTVCINANP